MRAAGGACMLQRVHAGCRWCLLAAGDACMLQVVPACCLWCLSAWRYVHAHCMLSTSAGRNEGVPQGRWLATTTKNLSKMASSHGLVVLKIGFLSFWYNEQNFANNHRYIHAIWIPLELPLIKLIFLWYNISVEILLRNVSWFIYMFTFHKIFDLFLQ